MNQNVQVLKDLPLEALISAPLNAVIKAQAEAALSTANFIERIGFINKSDKKSSLFDKPKNAKGDEFDVRVAKLQVIKKIPSKAAIPESGEAAFPNGMKDAAGNIPSGANANAANNDGNHPGGLPVHADAVPAVPSRDSLETVELPFISMVNIPSVEISELNWDFNVKLNQVDEISTDFGVSTELEVNSDSNLSFGLGKFLSIGNSMKVQSTTKTDFESHFGSTREQEYNLKIGIKARQAAPPRGLERLMNIAETIATNNERVNAAEAAKK